jgi:hypothetical protein
LGKRFGGNENDGDPILDEIWRVREELHKKHGGLEGYIRYIQKLDRARQNRLKKKAKKKSRKPVPASH